MKCDNCRNPIHSTSKFCGHCGCKKAIESKTKKLFYPILNNKILLAGALLFICVSTIFIIIPSNKESKEEKLWNDALIENSIESYELYRMKNPESKYYEEALLKIKIIKDKNEEQAWENASRVNTIDSYQRYIDFNGGEFSANYNKQAKDAIDLIRWNFALDQNTLEGFTKYKNEKIKYQSKNFIEEANKKIKENKTERKSSTVFNEFKGLIAYYPFNGDTEDESGYNVISSAQKSYLSRDRFGKNNRAYRIDGANGHFYIEDKATNNLEEGTISFWAKAEPGTTQYNLFSKRDALRAQLGSRGLGDPLETFYFIVANESKRESYAPNSRAYQFTNWNHYTFTWSKNQKQIFLNGKRLYSVDGSFRSPSNGKLNIGRNATNSKEIFNGYIDDIRIYNVTLSDKEILHIYRDKKTVKKSDDAVNLSKGLIAYYPFNGNANDKSHNSNNGNVNAGALLTADRFGNENNAYNFQQSSTVAQYIESNSDFNFNPAGEFSFSLWFNWDGNDFWYKTTNDGKNEPTGYAGLLGIGVNESSGSCYNSSATRFYLNIWNTGQIGIQYSPDGCNSLTGQTLKSDKNLFLANSWNHVVVTHDGTGNLNIYLNNKLIASKSDHSLDLTSLYSKINIGNMHNYFYSGTYQRGNTRNLFSGKIDEVRIHNKTLNTSEIKSLFEQ